MVGAVRPRDIAATDGSDGCDVKRCIALKRGDLRSDSAQARMTVSSERLWTLFEWAASRSAQLGDQLILPPEPSKLSDVIAGLRIWETGRQP